MTTMRFFWFSGERRSEFNATAGRILLLRVMCPKIMWRQFPPNLEKNPPQNYVAAVVPAESQNESAPKGSIVVPAEIFFFVCVCRIRPLEVGIR